MAEFSGRPQETNQTTIVQTQIYRITTGKETIVVTTATNHATTSPTTTTTTQVFAQALLTQLAATTQGSNQALVSALATVANIAGTNSRNQKDNTFNNNSRDR
jgi:hypothetical protein